MKEIWRVGRSVFRTIYIQHGDEPAKGDALVGLMDTPELARRVVDAVNAIEALKTTPPPGTTPPTET